MTTIRKGTTFSAVHCEESVEWKTIVKAGREAWKCVALGQDFAGTVRFFGVEEIECSLRRAAYYEESRVKGETFYASLVPGSAIHYDNGFGAYVRCVVTEDRKLRAVALLGRWSSFDLAPDAFYPRTIASGETFTPHQTTIVESPEYSKRIDISALAVVYPAQEVA